MDDQSTSLTSTAKNIETRTITCPDSGYVFVTATCAVQINHVNGTMSAVGIGVSDSSATLFGDQRKQWIIPSANPTGNSVNIISAQKIYPVTSGSHTFYLVGQKIVGGGNQYALHRTFSLVYVPRAYGTVSQ